jgi:tRNA-2-methylthio-N6-dimethylallyladenosine synthase
MSGDFIVGFPEETDADFEDTMELVRQVRYGQCYSFKYSTRPGTPAAERAQVDADVASERLQRLQALLTQQQTEIQAEMVGKEVGVLFEKVGRREGQLIGKSDHLHAVHAEASPDMIGKIARVRITSAAPNSLAGKVI